MERIDVMSNKAHERTMRASYGSECKDKVARFFCDLVAFCLRRYSKYSRRFGHLRLDSSRHFLFNVRFNISIFSLRHCESKNHDFSIENDVDHLACQGRSRIRTSSDYAFGTNSIR